ncbi:MAG TPA: adenylyl-sulfate kinase [Chitinophagaceae bacterium]|jgi:adenylylsulfate kinase|nr:adenylyl-sulfate kinase [Chitinophagaceae bacterium]
MLLIQLTGLSGSGKTTIANGVKKLLVQKDYRVEIIDGDVYRKILCPDLGFSKEDRNENIRRLGFVANVLATHGVIAILAAINPYESIRQELQQYGTHVKTIWINCDIETLIKRDTKQLYRKAMLPDDDPGKVKNLTGINDPYEAPQNPDLIIDTHLESERGSIEILYSFILKNLPVLFSIVPLLDMLMAD